MTKTSQYKTSPAESSSMPPGIPYIVGNEAAERFSYYGMRCILTVFMTKYLLDASGEFAPMTDGDAKKYVHLFGTLAYFTPLLGALAADWFWGKYKTILSLSLVYCLGHLALALDETRLGLLVGLTLIAIGAGGIKPCVSAHVGDQFGKKSSHLMNKVYNWFYFSINLGAFASTLITPILLDKYGPQVAFGLPGILMFIATCLFWVGRNDFIHVPAKGNQLWQELFAPKSKRAILKLIPIYLLVSVFWSVFDQTASAWVLQADKMEHQVGKFAVGGMSLESLNILPTKVAGYEILDSQMQALNPIFILVLIPLVSLYLYPAINRFFPLSYMRKMTIGMFLTTIAFTSTSLLQEFIEASPEQSVHIFWQIVPYFLLTLAEVFVSITCLEFSYTQAPNSIKSIVMAIFWLSVSLGNFITYIVNVIITREDGTQTLSESEYYWLFTGIMLGAAVLFSIVAKFYQESRYIQGETNE